MVQYGQNSRNKWTGIARRLRTCMTVTKIVMALRSLLMSGLLGSEGRSETACYDLLRLYPSICPNAVGGPGVLMCKPSDLMQFTVDLALQHLGLIECMLSTSRCHAS